MWFQWMSAEKAERELRLTPVGARGTAGEGVRVTGEERERGRDLPLSLRVRYWEERLP